jgi:dihydroorotate dehydrogenase
MRLLIYFLAMMTGFSAAEAARPVSTTPAAVAQSAVIAASAASVEREMAAKMAEYIPALELVSAAPDADILSVNISSPVLRHDITRQ